MLAGRSTLKNLGIVNYASRFEFSTEDWNEDNHPHLHALVDTPSGGRDYVSADGWLNEWLTQLPEWLHPVEGGSHVKPIRNLAATCSYLMKSAYTAVAPGASSIGKMVSGLLATKGIQKLNLRGTLAVA